MKRLLADILAAFMLSACSPNSATFATVATAIPPTARPIITPTQPSPTTTVIVNQGLHFSAAQYACWNLARTHSNVTQIEVLQCAQDDLDQQRAKLANLISEIKLRITTEQQQVEAFIHIPADTQAKLDELQTGWEQFIEEQCKWETRFNAGSSSGPMVRLSCLATRTSERIQQMKVFLCADEGFFGSCPAAEKY